MLEVVTTYNQKKLGIEIRIDSLSEDESQSWITISLLVMMRMFRHVRGKPVIQESRIVRSSSMDDGELYRLEIRNCKKVFTKPRHDSSKSNTGGGGKGRTGKECFRCGRIGHTRADCRAKTHLNGGPTKSAPKGKCVGSCKEEEPETSQNVPLGTIDLGSFKVLSDHGDTVEDDADADESSEATRIMQTAATCFLVQGDRDFEA